MNFSQLLSPYSYGVRIGNWYEDIALEEETLKNYLAKRERNELLCQRVGDLWEKLNAKFELSVSRDGFVHFGDRAMIVNPGGEAVGRPTFSMAMSLPEDAIHDLQNLICADVQSVTGGEFEGVPTTRGSFMIMSCDGSHNGEVLRYGQPFYLTTADGRLFLQCDRFSFSVYAEKSRHCLVNLVNTPSHLTEWMIKPFDPRSRMELEYSAVQANSRIIFTHIKTNQNLNLEDSIIRTAFGTERELSCWSRYDSHKAETEDNHWMILMSVPGDDILPIQVVKDQPCKPCY